MKYLSNFIVFLVIVVTFTSSVKGQVGGLERDFYKKTCPKAEQIVRNITWTHVANNSKLPAKLLRMFFHDCFVEVRTLTLTNCMHPCMNKF